MYIWMKVHSNNHGSSSCTAGSRALDNALEALQAAVDEGRAIEQEYGNYTEVPDFILLLAISYGNLQCTYSIRGTESGQHFGKGPVNQMHISIHFDFVYSYDSDESLVMDDQQPGMMTCELSHNRLTIRNAFSPQTSTFSACTGRLCLWFSESLFLPSLALPIIVHGALSQMLSIRPDNWSSTSHLMQLCLPWPQAPAEILPQKWRSFQSSSRLLQLTITSQGTLAQNFWAKDALVSNKVDWHFVCISMILHNLWLKTVRVHFPWSCYLHFYHE